MVGNPNLVASHLRRLEARIPVKGKVLSTEGLICFHVFIMGYWVQIVGVGWGGGTGLEVLILAQGLNITM